MTEDTGSEESIEDRVDALEQQRGFDIENLTERMQSIEQQQSELKDEIDGLANRLQTDDEQLPHIDTVEGLYDDLVDLDNAMADSKRRLDQLTTDVE